MILKNSALHRKGAKIAKVRKEKQFVGRNKRTALRRMRRVASGAMPFGYCALRSSVLHRKGAKIAKVRKEKQSATRTASIFHRHPQFVGRNKRSALRRMRALRRPQGEWPSTIPLLSPLRSLRLRAFAVSFSVRFSG